MWVKWCPSVCIENGAKPDIHILIWVTVVCLITLLQDRPRSGQLTALEAGQRQSSSEADLSKYKVGVCQRGPTLSKYRLSVEWKQQGLFFTSVCLNLCFSRVVQSGFTRYSPPSFCAERSGDLLLKWGIIRLRIYVSCKIHTTFYQCLHLFSLLDPDVLLIGQKFAKYIP